MTRVDRNTALRSAIDAFNRSSLAEFQLETGLRHLGDDGPIFLAGTVRIRALFVDSGGQYWCDSQLAVESAYRKTHPLCDHYRNAVTMLEPAHGLFIMTTERGMHDASITLITDVSRVLDLSAPEEFAPGWARSWRTFEWLDEPRALTLAATDMPGEPGLFERRGPAV